MRGCLEGLELAATGQALERDCVGFEVGQQKLAVALSGQEDEMIALEVCMAPKLSEDLASPRPPLRDAHGVERDIIGRDSLLEGHQTILCRKDENGIGPKLAGVLKVEFEERAGVELRSRGLDVLFFAHTRNQDDRLHSASVAVTAGITEISSGVAGVLLQRHMLSETPGELVREY